MNKNTKKHLDWFIKHSVVNVDLGILDRENKTMQLKINQNINELSNTLKYCTYKNSQNCDINIRPHRYNKHSIIFVDDITETKMKEIVLRFDCISVRTSQEGGFQAWISVDTMLNEPDRKKVQTFIQPFFKSDPKSLSGEHFGKLAGFKNNKRNGQYVNVYATNGAGRPIATSEVLQAHAEAVEHTKASKLSSTYRTEQERDEGLDKALDRIDSDDRSDWLAVGAALCSIDDRAAWDAWSSISSKFNEKEQNKAWRSFQNANIGLGIIFHIAYKKYAT